MKPLNLISCFICLLFSIGIFSCSKTAPKANNAIYTAKLYTGVVIQEACPSYAIIKVTNANIGDDWTFGTTYNNVIAISNRPDSTKVNGSISFYLSSSKNYMDCLVPRPCLQVIMIDKMPSKIYCARIINNGSK